MHCQNRSGARESSHVPALLEQIDGPSIWCFIAACTLFITSLHSLANNKHFSLNGTKTPPPCFSCIYFRYPYYKKKKKVKRLSRGEKERCTITRNGLKIVHSKINILSFTHLQTCMTFFLLWNIKREAQQMFTLHFSIQLEWNLTHALLYNSSEVICYNLTFSEIC